jgi:3-methylcrotonyl-CoA carboxylase alpha subunit
MEVVMGSAKRHARVGGRDYRVEAGDHVTHVTDEATGDRLEVATHYLGHGRLFLVEHGARRLAWVAEDDERRWVFCDGDVVVVDLVEPAAGARRRAASVPGHDTLAAPMPATVVRVVAGPGTRVAAGATVLLLEAMKMELPLRAPHDAVVSAVHCREGELVQPNVTLVDLDASPPEA